jgi:cytoskeletal protein RodZ
MIANFVRSIPRFYLGLIALIVVIAVAVAAVSLAQGPGGETADGADATPVPTVAAQAAARTASASTPAPRPTTAAAASTTAAAPAETGAAAPESTPTVAIYAEVRAQARVEVEQQAAVSRSGLPTAGDTLVDATGFEVTLVGVLNLAEMKQFTGSPFKPKNGVFKLVNMHFKNGSSTFTTIAKANIVLLTADGDEIAVSNLGTNALTGMVPDIERGRPLYLVESLPAGQEAHVSVAFDVPPGLTGLNIEIEGFLFEVPDPT